jgi:hypothetical protein
VVAIVRTVVVAMFNLVIVMLHGDRTGGDGGGRWWCR